MPSSTGTCRICSKLPETLIVDTDKGEPIPKELDTLKIIGGTRVDALGELRQCAQCQQYYRYWYDHDVSTGAGLGYSEHTLTKITEEQALKQKQGYIK